jgi:hypothetical protein
MGNFNFSDFYLGYPGHPRFRDKELIEDDVIAVIVQKWEMILFTNKGEVFGQPEFGGDLQYYLHETRLSSESIKNDLNQQISAYIPEIGGVPYTLEVSFFEDPERYQEYMEIYFQIKDLDVYLVVA